MNDLTDDMRKAARDLTERERFPKSSWVAVAAGMQHEQSLIVERLKKRYQELWNEVTDEDGTYVAGMVAQQLLKEIEAIEHGDHYR